MSFFSSLSSLFGGKNKDGQASASADSNAPVPKRNKSVYDEARKVPVPDWAQGLNNTDLTAQLRGHIKCRYMPNFGWKKIMTSKFGPDGNLIPEYDGIAGDCGAVKSFGGKLATRDGRTMPYKYVDLNMAFRCCCDIPSKCPFYLLAQGEAQSVGARRS